MRRLGKVLCLAALVASGFGEVARAQEPAFYAGKQIRLIVGTGVGGGYDAYARLVARFMGKYIPGEPTLVVQTMPGASGATAVSYLYANAPRDGLVIATFNSAMPFYQAIGQPGTRFKSEDLSWLGNLSQGVSIFILWHNTGVKTLADARRSEIIMGGTGTGGNSSAIPVLINSTLGTKFKVVSGYKTGLEVDLAMERGEVAGRASQTWDGWKVTRPDWVKTGKLTLLLQIGAAPNTGLSNVPMASDIAKTAEQKQIIGLFSDTFSLGRPLLTGPGVPANRVAILREAFRRTMTDTAFLAEAAKVGYEVTPLTGEAVQALINHMMAAPAAIIDKARDAITYKETKSP